MNLEGMVFLGPISADVDWIAGGNFSGGVYQNVLEFLPSMKARMSTRYLDTSFKDPNEIKSRTTIGSYRYSDHNTITLNIGTSTYRCKLLEGSTTFLACSITTNQNGQQTYCFERTETPIDELN